MSDYIQRELQDKIIFYFNNPKPKGLILTGIVGCGKTTLIEHVKKVLKDDFEIFSFSGDDAIFRQKVIEDTKYIWESIKKKTTKRSLIFVDEVQKIDEVFDSIKIAFDEGRCSFIVSGSNPAYLSTVAKKRLQRRADQIFMLPLSLSELILNRKMAAKEFENQFQTLLWETDSLAKIKIPEISWTEKIESLTEEFFIYGGLPLSVLSKSKIEKLREIRMTVERGFDLISSGNNSIADIVRKELALLQSQEFTYKHILEKTRQRQRDVINECIDKLINHGYLVKRKLFHFEQEKSSYISLFSYTDPGIVSYLTGEYSYQKVKGFQVEGYIHSRLHYMVQNDPRIAELRYFKEYDFDTRGNLRYLKSDVDFIFTQGQKIIPIECKSGIDVKSNELKPIKDFIERSKAPFGIVLYAGIPQVNKKEKILFWPYWLV
jgi:predicted AAA+ superfamily ATPase